MVDARGVRHSLTLDADGYLWPSTPDQVRLANQFGIPVATDWTFPKPPEAVTPEGSVPERPVATIPESTSPVDPDDLDDLTVAQLRERATALGLDVPLTARKADLIAAIEADDESQDDQTAALTRPGGRADG